MCVSKKESALRAGRELKLTSGRPSCLAKGAQRQRPTKTGTVNRLLIAILSQCGFSSGPAPFAATHSTLAPRLMAVPRTTSKLKSTVVVVLRRRGHELDACCAELANRVFGTLPISWSISHFGASETIRAAVAIAVVGAGLSQWLAPETKGKSLTEAAAGYMH